MFNDEDLPKNDTTNFFEDLEAAKVKNEMVSITRNKTRGPLTHQTICWNSYGKLPKHDLYMWGETLWESPKWEKLKETREQFVE